MLIHNTTTTKRYREMLMEDYFQYSYNVFKLYNKKIFEIGGKIKIFAMSFPL